MIISPRDTTAPGQVEISLQTQRNFLIAKPHEKHLSEHVICQKLGSSNFPQRQMRYVSFETNGGMLHLMAAVLKGQQL